MSIRPYTSLRKMWLSEITGLIRLSPAPAPRSPHAPRVSHYLKSMRSKKNMSAHARIDGPIHSLPPKSSTERAIEKGACAHMRTCTQPTPLFAVGAQLAAHSQPALRTGLMAPAWRRALCIWGVIPELLNGPLSISCTRRAARQTATSSPH